MKFQFALALLLPAAAFAAGPIDGTWKTDMSTMKVSSAKPNVYKLKDGMYTCSSCSPPFTVKADGTDQPVKGRAYSDSIAVTVVDPMNVTITGKQAGKVVYSTALTVSADGNTLTSAFKSMAGAEPVTGTATETRKGSAPKGEHAISGKWESNVPPSNLSDSALTVTFASTPDGLSMKSNGMSYEAKFDGKQVPIMGDPGKTMAVVKKSSDKEYTETDYRMGKKVEAYTLKVSDDGKTATVVDKDFRSGAVTKYTMNKQS